MHADVQRVDNRPEAKHEYDEDRGQQKEVGRQGFPASTPLTTRKESSAHLNSFKDAKPGIGPKGRPRQPAQQEDASSMKYQQAATLPGADVGFTIESNPSQMGLLPMYGRMSISIRKIQAMLRVKGG
jgi:hypothetical protein